ncbi:MAG TPA: MmgE/PrpD family protein [Candidatus Limnocylindrales bacterium]|nr:MmgE/PrpD family protein [Candidatus Limnocylindrales bacterium]
MSTPPPVTDTLARFVTDTDFASISEKTRANAKMHILDTLGVALAGSKTAVADIAIDYCKKLGASSEASIWGTSAKASVSTAAFANGLLSHALDYDDWDAFIHVGHPSSMLVGAAVPLAEHLGASGKDLLKAYVLAMEVICKLAANSPNLQDRGFHSTPVFGSLGAAVACGSLLKLDAAKLKAAIGVAASAAGGIHRQQGSMVKPFHAGNSARNGAEAALLASNGFTADAAIFEAPRGFCDTFFGKDTCDYDKMIENLGKPYFFETPGMGLKWHPCSAPQFLAADAALHLKHEYKINFADVVKMEVSIPPLRYQRHYAPEVKTGLRGKFAINYVVAMAVLDGKLEIATFTDEKVNQPQVQDALSKVKVIVDESIPEPGPYCPVSVELKDGTRHSYTAKIAKGDPRNPMTEAEVMGKFRGNAKLAISDKQTEAVMDTVSRLESVDNVKTIVDLLTD